MQIRYSLAFSLLLLLLGFSGRAQQLTARQIVEKAYYSQRGPTNKMTMSMRIIRPSWSREMRFTTWSRGNDQALMRVVAPAKDQGVGFLKLKSEGWNWLPTIERVVKISPSQMAQSWMGSDFTNEDMLREASIIYDYTHEVVGEDELDGVRCYRVQATPTSDAPVVWGKILLWVGKDDLLERKTEYYDETGQLINTRRLTDIKPLGGKRVATHLEMVPATKAGRRTVVTIEQADFNAPLTADFFSLQTLKRAQ